MEGATLSGRKCAYSILESAPGILNDKAKLPVAAKPVPAGAVA